MGSVPGYRSHFTLSVPFLSVRHSVVFPCLFGSLELRHEFHFFVAECACLLELLLGDGGFLVLADNFEATFQLGDFARNIDVLDMHAGASLVQSVNGLVWQVSVAEVTVGELHASLNGFGCIGH